MISLHVILLLSSIISAFFQELSLVDPPDFCYRVSFFWTFVFSYSCYSCKSQGHTACVFRTSLNFVVSYFYNNLRNDIDLSPLLSYGQRFESIGQFNDFGVSKTLKGLSNRLKHSGFFITSRQIIV